MTLLHSLSYINQNCERVVLMEGFILYSPGNEINTTQNKIKILLISYICFTHIYSSG